jgi:YegS/Rv2252/BmrU family lipid kinase
MPERGLLLVTNPEAGSAAEAAVKAVVSELVAAGADVRNAECSGEGELADVLRGREGRQVVVVGGDGSVHTLVAALDRDGALAEAGAIGIIPLGTGNDLARTLGIPLEDPVAAAQLVLSGRSRRLDLFDDDAGGVVVNAVHAGLGAEAGEAAASWKNRLGAAAYAVGSVVAGATSPGWRLRVDVDGEVLDAGQEPVLMVGLGNGRTIGGGTELAPDAEPDDGLIDVVVSLATGPAARVAYAAALKSGDHLGRGDVRTARGRQVAIRGDAFPLNADGELSGPVTERTWTIRPGAWAALVPR